MKLFLGAALLFASTQAMAVPEWTMLIFASGHNDLDSFIQANINQMEVVGSTSDVSVVVQSATLTDPDHTTRLLVRKDSDSSRVTSPVLEDLGRVDMGDARVLKEFILWGIAKFPARRYMVVVGDHGSGWHLRGASSGVRPTDISWDELTGNKITTRELGQVMQDVAGALGRPIDVYGSDACLMSMAEVAAEMKGAVDQVIGSQDYEPGAGWPYDTILAELTIRPAMNAKQLSQVIAEKYVAFYEGEQEVTFSGFDMSKFDAFESALADLSRDITGLPAAHRANLGAIVRATRSFGPDDGDLGELLSKLSGSAVNAQVVARAEQALKDVVSVLRSSTAFGPAHGLSIWLPRDKSEYSRHSQGYKDMRFERNVRWSSVLEAYLL